MSEQDFLTRFEKITGTVPHIFIKRGIISHDSLAAILHRYERKLPFYLYSACHLHNEAMHLGQWAHYIFCKWLQDTFDVPLIVQLQDDRKFLTGSMQDDLDLETCHNASFEFAKDLVACGLDVNKTLIFSSMDYFGGAFYHTSMKISRCITTHSATMALGLNDSDNIGRLHYIALQVAPTFPHTFPRVFNFRTDVMCFVPCIDAEDNHKALHEVTCQVATKLKWNKPFLMDSHFVPSLQDPLKKMFVGNDTTTIMETHAILMSDPITAIKTKINKHAYSGGQATKEEHEKLGGNPDIDVSFLILKFLEKESDNLLDIERDYRAGIMLSGKLKSLCIHAVQTVVGDFQSRRKQITDRMVHEYMDRNRKLKFNYL